MATAEVQRLLVTIGLKDGLSGPIGKINRSLAGFDKGIGKIKAGLGQLGSAAIRVGAVAAAAGVALLVTQVKAGLDSLAKLENAQAQTQAVLKSTGGVAGVTATQIRSLAESLEDLAPQFDDKAIQGAENLLLTFTKIGKDIFPTATKAVLDMSQALGTDLDGAAIQVGKALQDPVRGMLALRRAGVSFTKDQEKVIKALVESGDLLGAQTLILKELDKEFGGSAEGGLGKFAKVQARIKDAVEELQMALARGLLPVIERLAPKLNAFLRDPQTVANIERLGQQIADLFSDKNIASAAELFRGVQQGAQLAFEVASKAVALFRSLPPELQKAAIAALVVSRVPGAGLIASGIGSIVGVLLRNLTTITAANVTVIGGNVTGGGVPSVAGAATGGLGLISKVFLVGEAIGLAALVTQVGLDQQKAIDTGIADVGGKLKTLITSSPSKEQLERSIRGLEAMPGKLGIVERAIFEANLGGAKSVWEASLAELRRQTALAGNFNSNLVGLNAGLMALKPQRDPLLQRLLGPILDWQKTRTLGGLKGPAEGGNVAKGFIGRLDTLKVTDPEVGNIAKTIADHLIDVSTNVKTLQGVQRELTSLQTAAIANGQFTLAARLGADLASVKAAIDSLPAPVVNVTVPVNVSVRALATSLDFAKTYHMAGTY